MKIATSSSSLESVTDAVGAVSNEIEASLDKPDLILVYYTETQNSTQISSLLNERFPDTQIIGCSSCQGLMTEKGYFRGHQIAVWAVSDPLGAYGAAVCTLEEGITPFLSAQLVLRKAISESGRPGELPALIALHTTPGIEETVLEAIRDELGVAIPIIGGTAADDNLEGLWSLFDGDTITSNGIGMAVFYPTARVSYSFHSGYANTGHSAIATRVNGRVLQELDGQPAATVYSEWYKKETGKEISRASLFAESTLLPLGRETGTIHEMPYYTLSHPAMFTEDNGIDMFCNIVEGERVNLMSGTRDMLVSRAGRVIDSANDYATGNSHPVGGIAIYCAGCMLHVNDFLDDVALNMNQAMCQAPFVCPFTFGEQGQFLGGEITHGNLMISAVLFHKDEQ